MKNVENLIKDKVENISLKIWKEYEDKGIIPDEIKQLDQYIDKYFDEINKATESYIKIYDIKQTTMKLAGNGQYGAFVAKGFRFYNPHIGEAITSQGVEIIQMAQELVESLGYDVIYGDTDSMFISLDKHIPLEVKQKGDSEVEKYIQQNIVPNIYEHINKILDEHALNVGIPKEKKHYFEMKQEMIGKKMLLLEDRAGKGYAKKRYLIHVINEEGIKQDKIKATGVEIRRSEIPKFLKDKIWKFVEGFMKDTMTNDELLKYLMNVKKELIEEIDNKRVHNFGRLLSVKDLDEYKSVRRTQQSYGTQIWNTYVAPIFNVKYIESGQKVIIVYIKLKSDVSTINKELLDLYNLLKKEKISYFIFNPIVEIEKIKDLFTLFDIDKDITIEKMFYNQIEPYLKALNLDINALKYGVDNVDLDDLI